MSDKRPVRNRAEDESEEPEITDVVVPVPFGTRYDTVVGPFSRELH